MASTMTGVRLTIQADKKTYFSTKDVKSSVPENNLKQLAQAINSLQDRGMDKVTKTVEYLLLP